MLNKVYSLFGQSTQEVSERFDCFSAPRLELHSVLALVGGLRGQVPSFQMDISAVCPCKYWLSLLLLVEGGTELSK